MVSAKIQSVAFSCHHEAAYQSLATVCSPLKIGVLGRHSSFPLLISLFNIDLVTVNNVGKSHAIPVYFVDTTKKEMDDILSINIHVTLRMTQMVLPGMISR